MCTIEKQTLKHMKIIFNKIAVFALSICCMVSLSNCGGSSGDDPSDQEIQAEKLAGTWTIINEDDVSVADKNSSWENFSITLTGTADGGTYVSTGAPAGLEAVWANKTNGTWKFGGSVNEIIRDNTDTVFINNVTETGLSLGIDVSQPSISGRVEVIGGSWTFNFTKSN